MDRMTSVADDWWSEDRQDLFRALEVIASEAPGPDRIGESLDTILNDLELYDDPRQGAGMWLYDDELQPADQFGERLHGIVGATRPEEAGAKALAHPAWAEIRSAAISLLELMKANGDFVR